MCGVLQHSMCVCMCFSPQGNVADRAGGVCAAEAPPFLCRTVSPSTTSRESGHINMRLPSVLCRRVPRVVCSTPPPPCKSYANVQNYYCPYAHCSLDKGVAYTLPPPCRSPPQGRRSPTTPWGMVTK